MITIDPVMDGFGFLRSTHVTIADEAGGLWKFEVVRYVKDVVLEQVKAKAGTVEIKEAMFAKGDNSMFGEPGAIAVPLSIRMQFAESFKEVTRLLFA